MKATKNTLKKRKHYPKWESEKTVRKGGVIENSTLSRDGYWEQ